MEFVCNTRKLTARIVSLKIMQGCAESKKIEYYVEKYCNVKRIWKVQLVMEIWNIAVEYRCEINFIGKNWRCYIGEYKF